MSFAPVCLSFAVMSSICILLAVLVWAATVATHEMVKDHVAELSLSISVCLPAYLHACLPVSLSVCMSVCLSVCLSVWACVCECALCERVSGVAADAAAVTCTQTQSFWTGEAAKQPYALLGTNAVAL